jgi:hypothetical protein
MNLRCDTGTQVDSNLTCEDSAQTPNENEQPENRTDGGAAEKEKEEMKRKITSLEKFLDEKDRKILKLNATIQEMKEQQRREIHFIKTKQEMEKTPMLRKTRKMSKENEKIQ